MKYWRRGLGKYTATVRTFLPDVASRLGLQLYNGDYYTLDAVFYQERDLVNFSAHQTFVKYICVAFEHENAIGGSANEICKLQLINSPLKVLVTYGNEVDRSDYLARYARIIADADTFGDLSTLRRQLVIFGEEGEGMPVWHPYLYADNGFVSLI